MKNLRCSLDLTKLLSKSAILMKRINQNILCSEHIAYTLIEEIDNKYLKTDTKTKEQMLSDLGKIIEEYPKVSDRATTDEIILSGNLKSVLEKCCLCASQHGETRVNEAHFLAGLLVDDITYGAYYLSNYVDLGTFISDHYSGETLNSVEGLINKNYSLYSDEPVGIIFLLTNKTDLTEEELEEYQDNLEKEIESGEFPNGPTMVDLGSFAIGEEISDELIEAKLAESGIPDTLKPYFARMIKNSINSHMNSEAHHLPKNGSNTVDARESNHKKRAINSIIDAYCPCMNDTVDLNAPFIGRQKELTDTIQTLCRMKKNNPIHVGEPGVGKTAVTEGLVRLIENGDVPDKLKGAKVYKLDMAGIVAGTKYRGEFEERLKKVLSAVMENADEGKPIVYIDEIHTVTSAGNVEGGTNASNILKNYLTDGKVSFIGATTYDEYKKVFSKDKALDRRFNKIDIKEPTRDECIQVLYGIKDYYEKFHEIEFTEGAIETCVDLSIKYINDKFLPDKAIDLLDEAGALKNTHPEYLVDSKVTDETISKLIATKFGISSDVVGKTEAKKVLDLKDNFRKRVFGQDEACSVVDRQLRIASVGLADDNKPKGSLLFVGPTGVGKTELAKTVADTLQVPIIRFNMSEYGDKTSVNKLIGSSAGYVGYENGGLLVDSIRKSPNCVLLLDEIEKADPAVFDILLQVMEEAELLDNQGRKADFKNVLLIMTSNCGANDMKGNKLGFSVSGNIRKGAEAIDESLKLTFRPEFLNRLTSIVRFNYIDKDTATKITRYKLNNLSNKLKKKDIIVKFHSSCTEHIVDIGVNEDYGAREIGRIIEREIKDLLAEYMLTEKLKSGDTCSISYNKSGFKINMKTLRT